jgi:hypothetical protein
MRALLIVLLYVGVARADGIGANAAIGAGGQGDATYSGIELGLDAQWRGARLGLGGRAVWLDGEWRDRDWREASDAVRAVRLLEIRADWFALAGGALAPAQIGHVVDGHRAALDDKPRTGVRVAAVGEDAAVGAEIDDVLDPSLAGGAIAWNASDVVRVRAAVAADPTEGASAIEAAAGRAWKGEKTAAEVGGGIVVEPQRGVHALAFAEAAIDRAGARWFANMEARAGSGTVGGAFGPLHRLERMREDIDGRGVGGAIAFGAVAENLGWARASVRARPTLETLATIAVGAPAGKQVQVGAWFAATRAYAAGAGEVRVAWAKQRYAAALEVARMYETDAMEPVPAWSAVAWFSIAAR